MQGEMSLCLLASPIQGKVIELEIALSLQHRWRTSEHRSMTELPKLDLPSRTGIDDVIERLRANLPTVWLAPVPPAGHHRPDAKIIGEIADARARLVRFRPALARLFSGTGWDGRINSALMDYPSPPADLHQLLVKCDHALPMTGSIKARGGVYELLHRIEAIATSESLISEDSDYSVLADLSARKRLSRYSIAVASTGNLGFSIGLVARAFGLAAQVHMSHDAKSWKKQRLIKLGVDVVEHDCDFNEAVDRGRLAAEASGAQFIDDTSSRDLLIGYAVAADELIAQLGARGIAPTLEKPLIVYLPCGVGGSPGGVTLGLKERLGDAVVSVFVEPTQSACMLAALLDLHKPPHSVYDFGLTNETIADGLAVARASEIVLAAVGSRIDAVVALPDSEMARWVGQAWSEAGLRLEPSASAAIAAVAPFLSARPDLLNATHVAWVTGGSLLPDEEFLPLLA